MSDQSAPDDEALASVPGARAPEQATCARCGSPRWVSVSLNCGHTVIAQCVPCGAYRPMLERTRADAQERHEYPKTHDAYGRPNGIENIPPYII